MSVVGVLTNQAPQRVYIWYTAGPQEPLRFVWDAQVKIVGPNGETALQPRDEVPNEPGGESYMDNGNPLPIHSGKSYRLEIITSGYNLNGATVVPQTFRILAPARNDTLCLQGRTLTLAVKWTRSGGAHGYVINLIYPRIEYPPGSGLYTRRNIASYETTDTTYALSTSTTNAGEYVMKVMAYDINYRRHYFESLDSVGIQGGYGVFASAWIDSVKFSVRE